MELILAVAYIVSVIVFMPPLMILGIKVLGRLYSQYVDWLEEKFDL